MKTNNHTVVETLVETLINQASSLHHEGATEAASHLLRETEKILQQHLLNKEVERREKHANLFLRIANLYLKFGCDFKNAASHAALEGLAVVTEVCPSPTEHCLWQKLMTYVPH